MVSKDLTVKKENMYPLSVCIITKDDATRLKRCLESLKNCPVEVVVVDTGSKDDTMNVIEKVKAEKPKCRIKTGNFKWIKDFAKAKNYAVSLAENPVIMILDSDEWIVEENFKAVVENLRADTVGRIKRINVYERDGEACENTEWINRVFYKEKFTYKGRIHEQLVNIENKGVSPVLVKTGITIYHDGYGGTKEEVKEKALRNIELLKESISREGEEPYTLYQIGKSYYMYGNCEKAIEYFEKALAFDVDSKLEYVIDMVETYGYALINTNQAERALSLEGVYDEFGASADFKFLMGLIYMNNQKFNQAVEEFLKATEFKECKMKGTNSYLAYYNAGVIMECLGYKEEAIILYNRCEGYYKADERIKEIDKK